MSAPLDLTILMPCLDEAETLASCIQKARKGIEKSGLKGEILVADNGSHDGSIEIAQKNGARVVHVARQGYGEALRQGMAASQGRWILMGDADDSYDFSEIHPFLEKLREGQDLVIGCRLPSGGGTITTGAMPWLHRWVGNPILSTIGRFFFNSPVHDFHCGMRALTREAFDQMDLHTTGMEFASEMVIQAVFQKLKVFEVPITLHPAGRSRAPHLRSWRDGWRHLRFMLLYSPRWLFLYPGFLLSFAGFGALLILSLQQVHLGRAALDIGTLSVVGMLLLIGNLLISFACFTKVFATAEGLLPEDPGFYRWFRILNLERGIALGFLILASGLFLLLRAWWIWKTADFGPLSYPENLRRVIPAGIFITLGVQIIFSSFFLSVLGLRTSHRKLPESAR